MTTEQKQLLIKDLCARLPDGVICNLYDVEDANKKFRLKELSNLIISAVNSECIKPYLRPMSDLVGKELDECRSTCKYRQVGQSVLDCATPETIDYLIAHHFDYRGLIPMGLALEAPEGMYEIQN
jgi:hypothetical protein